MRGSFEGLCVISENLTFNFAYLLATPRSRVRFITHTGGKMFRLNTLKLLWIKVMIICGIYIHTLIINTSQAFEDTFEDDA